MYVCDIPAQNCIRVVQNLGGLPSLQTLLLTQNNISSLDDLRGVLEVPTLTCLDLKNNKISDPEVLDLLEGLPHLAVLYLSGNPCVKKIRHYRKVVIARLPSLKYLDDRPVFDDERLRVDAWYAAFKEGGLEAAKAAEQAEIVRQRQEREDRDRRNHEGACGFDIGGVGG